MGIARAWRNKTHLAILSGLMVLFCLVSVALVLDLALGWSRWGAYLPDSDASDGPAASDSGDRPQVTIELGAMTLERGQVAEVPLLVRDVPEPGLGSFDLEISFAPDVIRVKEVLPGDPPWTDNSVVVSNLRGFLLLSNAKSTARPGTFLLARLKVEAVGQPHQSAAFSLGSALFRGAKGARMDVALVEGSIEIAGPAPGPLVEPPTISPDSDILEPPTDTTEGDAAEVPEETPEGDAAKPPEDRLEKETPEAPAEIPEKDTLDSPALAFGWLRAEGNKIINAAGEVVRLRGVGIENREWVWSSNKSIDFEKRAIPKATAAPPNGWGANVILLAVASGPIKRNDATYLGNLDQLVALAKANGAYSLLVYRYSEPNGDQPNMPDQAAQDAMAALAARYANEPAVLYGLQVEPHDVSWSQLKPRFISMIDAIRARNPRALIAVPGTQWGRYVHWALTDPIPRENLVYKVHYYDPFSVVETEYQLSMVAARYPILLGEFGAGSQMGLRDVDQLLDLSELLGISWVGWLFHDKGCPCMLRDASTFSTTPFGAEIQRRLRASLVEGPAPVVDPTPEPTPTPSPPRQEEVEPTATPPAPSPPPTVPSPPPPVRDQTEIGVTIRPSSARVSSGETAQFTAAVSGTPDQRVTWSLEPPTQGALSLVDPFTWQGTHAATIADGAATTVWWDEDAWDTRTDSAHNAVAAQGHGNHIDIHRGSSDISSGQRLNDRYVLGGDGSPGVGVMHLDFEGIISARLRNPMLIADHQPGVVEFHAPTFVTTGHWWEVAISPASQVVGGDFTAVPSTGDEFAGLQGSGHSPPEDSINFIILGRNDVPCKTGWEFRTGVNKAVGHETREYLGPVFPTDPQEKDKLYRWRLRYFPDRLELSADLDEDGVLEPLHTFPVRVPWSEAYVHLLGVAYQASKHPQDGDCGAYQGQVREFPWKEVKTGPLKYLRTAAYPKNGADWVGYDLRDTQRFGEVSGVSQPNAAPYQKHFSLAFCSDAEVYGCRLEEPRKDLTLDLPAGDSQGMAGAQLVYDTRGEGVASLFVNGVSIGDLPGAESVPAADEEQWVRRSVRVPASLLVVGENRVRIVMRGSVQMDRLEFEVGYGNEDVSESLGSISPEGVYHAPPAETKVVMAQVRATSVADPSKSALALVTVTPVAESASPEGPARPAPGDQPSPVPTPVPAPPILEEENDSLRPGLALVLVSLSSLLVVAGAGYWVWRVRQRQT